MGSRQTTTKSKELLLAYKQYQQENLHIGKIPDLIDFFIGFLGNYKATNY